MQNIENYIFDSIFRAKVSRTIFASSVYISIGLHNDGWIGFICSIIGMIFFFFVLIRWIRDMFDFLVSEMYESQDDEN